MTSTHAEPTAKPLFFDYYTNPLCYQSWAFEPHWRRLRAEFGHQFAWRYRLDERLLYQAAHAMGTPMSSQLACLAVRCAEQQSPQAGDLYLQAARVAALRDGRNLAQPEVLIAIASELAAQMPGLAGQLPPVLDVAAFRQSFLQAANACTFKKEEPIACNHSLQYLPSLVLRRAGWPNQAVALTSQPYEVLLHALAQAAPDLFYVASLEEGGAG